ncbi:hypothetical protein COHA_008921 [Chlorella ohadii]|uniref:Uncharacterized protein n=1 Tax=Chlorella ohadii TaxID=2649997 RepID=A0AAD5H2R8_9CHLO|nr:hypothetical protein COHA_008921 [Chlorella ohadii]
MDALDLMLGWLPSLTDLVIYGAMASASAAIFAISFFGIVGSFYRDTNPLLPATRALAAALTLMAPLAVLLVTAFAVAESRGLYMVYSFSLAPPAAAPAEERKAALEAAAPPPASTADQEPGTAQAAEQVQEAAAEQEQQVLAAGTKKEQ